jgi:dCTP deaminase
MIEGRSSIGRLGIRIHATAGFGDIGFSGNWTLEIDVVQPVKIYAGIEICQIFYHTTLGGLTKTYKGKYQGSKLPLPSAIWKEFQQE